ncbi:MAG: hypothetical protein H7Y38_02870 [Armatimonadetes bacterium]|nr:hypothetical protein [Armatimonadota bacterium]
MTSILLNTTSLAARTLCFDLHPLYATILSDGSIVREGEVIGLDNDLSRVLLAPFTGTLRTLVTGQGDDRRVKVYLTEGARNSRPVTLSGAANYLEANRN